MDTFCCNCGTPTTVPQLRVTIATGFYYRRYYNFVCRDCLDILDTMLEPMSRVRTRNRKVRQLTIDAPLGA